MSPAVGAYIACVDFASLGDERFGEVRRAFSKRGVVLFREQELTPDQPLGFARRWGEVTVNRCFTPVSLYPVIAEGSSRSPNSR